MAIYRNVHTTFWSDTKVCDEFTPEDKYFMLYCLTNNHTNLCGCYEISIKQMSRDLGYNEEMVKNLLERFSKIHKIIFYNEENKELLIKNWYKYNWTKSEKLDKPLLKEIEEIKTQAFKEFVVVEYNKRDTVSIPYKYHMDTTVTATATVTDSISDINIISNKQQEEQLQQLFVNCTSSTNLNAIEECISYLDDLPYEVIEVALKKTSEKNGGWKYAKTILQNWLKAGIKTIEQVKSEELSFKANNGQRELTKEEQEQKLQERIERARKRMEEQGIGIK